MSVVPPEPEALVSEPPKREPLTTLGKSWVVMASVAALLLGSALFGLIPAREPAPPPTVRFDPAKAVDPVKTPETHVAVVHKLVGWSVPVCARPKEGARLYRVALAPERDAFAVWCAGEYVLLEVEATAETPRVTRLARFPARGELPGGATSIDLDQDGVLDLALGVAPALGVVHRPGAGLFLLRGRAQGGYEIARALVEMPVVATLAAELDEQPGAELLVLTRGDVAAQRPGDLWVFVGGSSPARAAVIPTALAPNDLALGPAVEGQNELWVASTQPGSLVRLKLPATRAAWTSVLRAELPLPGLQAFVAGPRGERGLFVRDLEGARAVDDGATIKLGKVLVSAEIGPASWLPGQRVLAATQQGFTVAHADKRKAHALPTGLRVVDASSTRGANAEQRGLLLLAPDDPAGNLSLVVLPAELRDEASELELHAGALEAAPGEARVTLE
ncbi:MAG TPA: hypothetical protein VFX59_12150 [Polyangiales bacterium]|nr:hypothetical protein [Polyangiales bacterium]